MTRAMKPIKGIKHAASAHPWIQYAALPWRNVRGPEILLVSTRGAGRWIIPKGWPMKGRAPYETAALEAAEEAGVIGAIGTEPVGSFRYIKNVSRGEIDCMALVYPLRVTRQLETWPERNERTARWLGLEAAAELVLEADLRDLILNFGRRLQSGAGIDALTA